MSLTRDFQATANDNDDRIQAGAAGRQLAVLPRSPTEALQPMRPPEPPDHDEPEPDPHPFLRMLDGLVTFVFLLACLGVGVFYWLKVQFDQPGPLATSTVFVVPKGEGVSAIAERLEQDSVIDDRRVFMTSILYFMYLKGQGSLKAGEYEFRKSASMRQVLDTLVEGKSLEHTARSPRYRPRVACCPTHIDSAVKTRGRTSLTACRPRIRNLSPRFGKRVIPRSW
jgi:hypothetical protein